jgi:hypothetical protein
MISMSVKFTRLTSFVLEFVKIFQDLIDVLAVKDTELELIQDHVKVG